MTKRKSRPARSKASVSLQQDHQRTPAQIRNCTRTMRQQAILLDELTTKLHHPVASIKSQD